MMLPWTLRILTGPLRPFLVRKLLHAVRERVLVRRTRGRFPSTPNEARGLRMGLVPLPSAAWIAEHGRDVLDFAERMRSGRVQAFGIESWTVGAPDPENVDVRCVHELSRMHHWCAYALAAHCDPDRRDEWCATLADEVRTFIASYPPEHGTHWAFPMGTGIRLHSLLVAWDWARQTGWSNPDADRRMAATAVDHARSVYARREERGGLSTSHFAANCIGLLAAGRYVTGEAEAEHWHRVATKALEQELLRQILADGMANEGSTGYHRQVVDTFVHAGTLMQYSPEACARLARAVEQLLCLERFGMPLIGDNDDGLTMKLTGFAPDCSYLVDVAQRFLRIDPAEADSVLLQEFGLILLRKGAMWLTFRNGPVGQFGKGGHAHNDMNSITVRVGAESFVVDPGTSVYTSNPALRNAQRSVDVHATMWRPHSEPRTLRTGSDGLFWLLEDGTGSLNLNATTITGTFAAHGLRHERTVTLHEEGIEGTDVLHGSTMGVVTFPFATGCRVQRESDRVFVQGHTATLEITWEGATASLEPIDVAPRFGHRDQSTCLRLHGTACRWWIRVRPAAHSISSQP